MMIIAVFIFAAIVIILLYWPQAPVDTGRHKILCRRKGVHGITSLEV